MFLGYPSPSKTLCEAEREARQRGFARMQSRVRSASARFCEDAKQSEKRVSAVLRGWEILLQNIIERIHDYYEKDT